MFYTLNLKVTINKKYIYIYACCKSEIGEALIQCVGFYSIYTYTYIFMKYDDNLVCFFSKLISWTLVGFLESSSQPIKSTFGIKKTKKKKELSSS